MIELKYPNKKFKEYIDFITNYCKNKNLSIILKGSLAEDSACEYSDIDIIVIGKLNNNNIHEIVYNYNNPILITISTNPKGMLIITYENEISVDLDFRKTIVEEDIICKNKILINNNISLNKSLIRHDLSISDFNNEYAIELLETLKLIVKGTNKYLSKKESVAYEFLTEIKEKCEKYFGSKGFEFNNNYDHDIKTIYEYLLSLYNIDQVKQNYFDKLIGKLSKKTLELLRFA